MSPEKSLPTVLIIGAGPAGLTAGYFLCRAGVSVTILEADAEYVGGISKTVKLGGFHFDIGGHRFFSKSAEVEKFWDELLPNDMLIRKRSSRIFYRNQLFSYPLRPVEALRKLGLPEAIRCAFSYFKAKLTPSRKAKSIEDWISQRFGWRLYQIFFKTYTEKVWGVPCNSISADWAAQRIKGLSVRSVLAHALFPWKKKKTGVKTLVEEFRYPRKGPGMMWEACAQRIREMGGSILMGKRASGLRYDTGSLKWTVKCSDSAGETLELMADHVISSAPIHDLIPQILPALPDAAKEAAEKLRYRDFLLVGLILNGKEIFSDNWLYIHDPAVKLGRIQNFKSWSPEMVGDAELNSYGLEYFCSSKEEFWSRSDAELISFATAELRTIGLLKDQSLVEGHVIRQAKAYPFYDEEYALKVSVIRQALSQTVKNLHLVGRNGMHKYNNQDHAIMTAMLTAKNILAGREIYDVWKVNQDAEYHEEISEP